MDNNIKVTNKKMNPTLKLAIAAVALFFGVLAFVPEAGVVRTIPFLFISGIIAGLLSAQVLSCASLTGVFSLCLYLVRGSSLFETVVFALLAVVLVTSGMYVVKLVGIAKRTQKNNVRKKCIMLSAAAVFVSVVISVLMCGNPVSFFKSDSDNASHVAFVNKRLGVGSVKKEYTSYDALSGEYRTYVSFKDRDDVIGKENDCYVSLNNKELTDNVRDYYEDKMLVEAERFLSNAVANVTSAFEVTASDVVLENDELILPDARYEDYASRIGYVVSFYSILDDEDTFLSLCGDVMNHLGKNGFDYKEIVFCGGNASEVLFAAQILPEMDYNTLISKYSGDFDGFNHVNLDEEYGVTEETILDYWNNK